MTEYWYWNETKAMLEAVLGVETAVRNIA